MSLANPNNISFYSPNPALQVFGTGSFTISISGTVAGGGSATYSGSTTLAQTGSLIRLFVNQNTVPGGFNAPPYTTSDWLPFPPYGTSTSGIAGLTIGCSVSGDSSVSGNIQIVNVLISGTSLSVECINNNPYSGTMTMTSTTLTFKYIAYTITPAFTG